MRYLINISLLFPLVLFGQMHIQSSALVHVAEGANLEVGGDLNNEGVIQNVGKITLYKNWFTNGNFNGMEGSIQFIGISDQVAPSGELTTSELIINSLGNVSFPGSEYTVLDRLDLQFGNIIPSESTRFILDQNAQVFNGSIDSYFEGSLINKGSGIKIFPLGFDGVYAPITLLDVFGVDTEIQASYSRNNPLDPIPGDSVIGVSHRGLWEVELLSGGTDATQVELQFGEEDLSDFRITNNIKHRVNSPVIAFANSPEGVYESLGLESLLNSDTLTFGTIIGKKPLSLSLGQKIYLAMALAPRIPDVGLFYIPEAFSPQASDARNQTFRVFGEGILEEGFDLQIFNRFGVNVFSTQSFKEANEDGWDGENQKTGANEPTGIYYYTVKFRFRTGLPVQKSGIFYLIR